MRHLINWIEIPATNLARATTFYSTIFKGLSFHEMEMNGVQYALFPSDDKFNCGALVQGDHYIPTSDGVCVYLDGGEDLENILKHVEAAGGKLLMEKTYTGKEAGYVGMFIDSEGNKIGLQNY
jgi:uncharacterized protein